LEYAFINFDGGDPDDTTNVFLPPQEWDCFKNPYNIYGSFIIRVTDEEFPVANFSRELGNVLGIPYYFIRVLSENPEIGEKTSVLVEIALTSLAQRDEVMLNLVSFGTNILTFHSSLYDGKIESIALTRELSCPDGCIHGSCYFGICNCAAGYTGEACENPWSLLSDDDGSDETLPSKPKAINGGEAAGIAVAFFVFGAIIGAVVFYFVAKKRVEMTAATKMIKMDDRTASVDLSN